MAWWMWVLGGLGLLAAENILEGKTHDLWAVNTDYGTYQESAVITKTGLEVQSRSTAEPVRERELEKV